MTAGESVSWHFVQVILLLAVAIVSMGLFIVERVERGASVRTRILSALGSFLKNYLKQ